MFHGSLPDSVQQIMGDCIRDWKCTDIYVGCSGNFTIERMLKGVTNARLHGNDVTIYSCLLGRYFSGAPLNARFNENYEGPMEFIQEYMKTDLDIATCVLLLSKMSTYLGSKPNPYYVRMIEAYKDQWPELFDKTRTKLEKAGQFLDSFYAGDVIGWVDDVPKDQGFVCYPPFYSGDYEKMFKVIESIIAWDPPEYDMCHHRRHQQAAVCQRCAGLDKAHRRGGQRKVWQRPGAAPARPRTSRQGPSAELRSLAVRFQCSHRASQRQQGIQSRAGSRSVASRQLRCGCRRLERKLLFPDGELPGQ